MKEEHLIHAARELANELDKVVDEHLPQKLAGIVKLHAKLAVGSAFIPIPGADIAAAAANTWAMYVRINKELQLPFGENITKSLAAGVMTNIGSNVVAAMVFATAAKFIPVVGTVGGAAVMATTVYALTIAAGIVYMKALTKLLQAKGAQEITEADLKSAADHVLQDKAGIRTIIDDAKSSYKHDEPVPAEPAMLHAGTVYVATGGKMYGPYLAADVRRLWTTGQLAKDAQYWVEGMDGWRPVARFPDVI